MPAAISDLFTIDVTETIAAGGTKIVANPGRTLKVVQVLVTGLNNAQCRVYKNTTGGAKFADTTLATGDLNSFPSAIVVVDAVLAATDNICIEAVAATAAISRVTLLCVAADGQALTVT
jgi:hypothetical protein